MTCAFGHCATLYPQPETFGGWTFIAMFLAWCVSWAVVTPFANAVFKPDGPQALTGKLVTLGIAVVGGAFGGHVIIGIASGLSGQPLMDWAAAVTRDDLWALAGHAGDVAGGLGKVAFGT